jgi:hypothetical protein
MRLKSATGAIFAVLYALVFGAAYIDYANKVGQWFADIQLVAVALPFTLTMRALNGGAYAFSGDATGRVAAAALFCCVLAYVAGAILGNLFRAAFRLVRRR